MSKISTYEVAPSPKLSDKLIGTSVGGEIEDVTYNFTLQELLDVFLPVIPANNLQGILDYGNTATQDINLFGTINTTNLNVTGDTTFANSYFEGDTHIQGGLFDGVNSIGTAGQVLTSTGDGVEWFTLPPIFTPNLQQVLEEGNTADIDIILDANIQALDISSNTANIGTQLTIQGVVMDYTESVGSVGQVLSSTSTNVEWVNLPAYSATSPLLFNSTTNVFSIQVANSTQNGYLSSSDWITFNGKQNAGSYITALTGEATATGPGSVPITLNNASVIAKVLTGLNITGGSISASDSILTAFGKVQSQINGLMGGVQYQGTWNAATNTPTLTSSVGTQGYYYIVNVDGNTNLNGITDWKVGDWAIFSGGAWQKVDNTDSVTSVNGQTGAVNLTTDNIPEGVTNLYFLNSRARAAVSATTPLSYNNTTGVFSIQQASGTQNGFLSSTDWTTFNSKQEYLGGTGLVKSTAGAITYITDNSSNWNTAYNRSLLSASVTGTGTKTLTLNQQDGGTIQASWTDADTGLTSVGLSMPSAFTVSNSPLTSNGTIGVTGAGTTAQYIRGDGSLATFPSIISEAQNLVTEVYNSSGATLTKGTVVYINGGQGNLPTITKAIATGDATSAQTYGIVRDDITNMNNGYVVVAGRLGDLDTQAYTPGQQLYLSSTTPGAFTPTKQYAPNHLVYVAIVVRAHPTQGVIEVMIQNGYEMDELHNVSAQNPNNNAILQYKTATSLWTSVDGTTTNIAEGTNLYYTDLRARGALSLTTIGTSGAATYDNTTGVFNIPQYQGAITNPITGTGTTNTLSKFTSASSIGNSNITDSGSLITLGSNSFVNGLFGVGVTPVGSSSNLYVANNITGGTSWNAVYLLTNVLSDVTSQARGFVSNIGTQAATFTLSNLTHYRSEQGTFRAGSTVTTQVGYLAAGSLIGATNNYGFQGSIPAGTNRWNIYMDGTANNYLAGSLGIGVTVPVAPLQLGNGYTDSEYDGFRTTDSPSFLMAYSQPSVIHRILGGVYSQAGTVNLDLSLAISKNKGTGSGFRITSGVGTGVSTSNNYLSFSSLTGAVNETFTATEYMRLDANGALGIGTTSLTNVNLRVSKNITGATTSYGIISDGIVQSGVTSQANYFRTLSSTQAATFTTFISHYAAEQGTHGAGSTVSEQYGFIAQNSLVGATTNYGFYGNIPSGTGRWNLYMNGTANNYMAGSLGIGSTSLTGYNLRVSKNITGATTSYGIAVDGTIQTDVTSGAVMYRSVPTTAASLTLTNLWHYLASSITIGSGGTVTNQYGFVAGTALTSATNNYGFYGDISAGGTNRWNIYMNGNAPNYLAGRLGIGIATPSYELEVFNGSANSSIVASTNNNGFAGVVSSFNSAYGNAIQMRSYGNTTASTIFGISTNGMNALWSNGDTIYAIGTIGSTAMVFGTNNTERARFFANGNFALNTATDAGFRLDVNGTGRFSNNLTIGQTSYLAGTYSLDVTTGGIAGIAEVARFAANGNGGTGRGSGIVISAPGSANTVSVARLVGYQETASATANNASFAIQVANSSGTLTEYLRINNSGGVGIGVSSINASARLQVDSTTQGFLPPRMTLAQRTAIATPATGLIVYQTDGVEGLWINTSTGWRELTVV